MGCSKRATLKAFKQGIAMTIALLALVPALAAAAPAFVLNHSGRLVDAADQRVNGAVALTFELHTAPAPGPGDAVVWHDAYPSVNVADGFYALLLGDTSTAAGEGHSALTGDLFAGDRWLAISVNGQPLAPWLRLGAVAASLEASHAADSAALAGKSLADLDARYAAATATALSKVAALSPSAPQSGSLAVDGDVSAATLHGDGAGVTNLDAAALAHGKLDPARLPAGLATLSADEAFTGAVSFHAATGQFSGDGSGLTGLSAGALTGAVLDAGLAGTYSGALALTNPANTYAGTFTGAGGGVTGVNAAQLGGQTLSQVLASVSGSARAPTASSPPDCGKLQIGAFYFDTVKGTFQGCTGSVWVPLSTTTTGDLQSNPGTTCAAIHAMRPTAPSGTYWLTTGGGGSAFAAWCDMTTDGGGWTLCASLGNQKRLNGFDFATATWNTGTTVFLNASAAVQAWGNFCGQLPVTELEAQAMHGASSVNFRTARIPTSGANPFTGAGGSLGTSGGYLAVLARTTLATNGLYYSSATCGTMTNGAPQGTQVCVGNGTTFQTMMGNVNGDLNALDWMCNYNQACGNDASNTILVFAR